MSIRKTFTLAVATLTLSSGLICDANAGFVSSGTRNGLDWTARNLVIGSEGAGTGNRVDLIGNPLYHPDFSLHSGVVGLIMNTAQRNFICSGALLNDRRSILTAAHCVSDGAGTANPLSTSIYFQPDGGIAPDERITNTSAGATMINVTEYFVHPDYTGEVIDQNDIAILRLADEAPDWAKSYGIFTGTTLTSEEFNVAGYGGRGTGTGGRVDFTTGLLRQGDNRYEYAWGNSAFNGFFTDIEDGENFFGTADVEFSYVSDFDNGLRQNDTGRRIAEAVGATGLFDDVGLGAREVGIAGGDSGGPNFINGLISGVNSYGLSFGPNFGDALAGLNSSFGEFSGYVPTYIHTDFINSLLVPVPVPHLFTLFSLGLFGVFASARARRAV